MCMILYEPLCNELEAKFSEIFFLSILEKNYLRVRFHKATVCISYVGR
jgi:hypothetical protein